MLNPPAAVDTIDHKPVPMTDKAADNLQHSQTHIYTGFLNIFVTNIFDKPQAEERAQRAFNGYAMQLTEQLELQDPIDLAPHDRLDLYAAYLVEELRSKARRQADIIAELAESVLMDQRNFLLAQYINEVAQQKGLGEGFSGIHADKNNPYEAFAYKLQADSSLQRGAAGGLLFDTIQQLSKSLFDKAQADIQQFLHLHQQHKQQQSADDFVDAELMDGTTTITESKI